MNKNISNKLIREVAFKENAYSVWHHALHFFQSNFLDKIITLHFSMGGKQQTITIEFQKQHFAHLAGVKYKKGSNSFWNDVRNKHIEFLEIENNEKNIGMFINKLKGLKEIDQILKVGVRITSSYDGELLKADNVLITQNRKLGFAIKKMTKTGIFVSTLNFERPNKYQRNKKFIGNPVHKITSFEPKTGEFKILMNDGEID